MSIMTSLVKGIAAAGIAVALAPSAVADGMSKGGGSIKDAPTAAPFSWTGRYIGANVGAAWVQDSARIGMADAATIAALQPGFDAGIFRSRLNDHGGGVIGGVQAGYNLQMQGVVLGVELDFHGTTAGTSRQIDTVGVAGGGTFSGRNVYNANLEWLSTLRGRLGFLINASTMAYATGGFAFGQINRSYTGSAVDGALGSGFSTGRNSSIETGWTVGGGLEWAFAPQWTVGAEYLFVSLEGSSFRTTQAGGTGAAACSSANCNVIIRPDDFEMHIARLKVNYKF